MWGGMPQCVMFVIRRGDEYMFAAITDQAWVHAELHSKTEMETEIPDEAPEMGYMQEYVVRALRLIGIMSPPSPVHKLDLQFAWESDYWKDPGRRMGVVMRKEDGDWLSYRLHSEKTPAFCVWKEKITAGSNAEALNVPVVSSLEIAQDSRLDFWIYLSGGTVHPYALTPGRTVTMFMDMESDDGVGDATEEDEQSVEQWTEKKKRALFTITRMATTLENDLRRGIFYAVAGDRDVDNGRKIVLVSGGILRDETAMHVVNYVVCEGRILILTINGCPVVNRARYERAYIPLSYSSHYCGRHFFRDDGPGRVSVYDDRGRKLATVDVNSRHKRGEVSWVEMYSHLVTC